MTQQIIDVGNVANDGTGDSLRTAFIKSNDNFTELYGGAGSASIANGTSNISIATANGNISTTVGGTPNVVVWTTTGEYVTGIVSATGNVAGNFFIGNGSLLTGVASSYGNADVVANLAALGSNPVSTTGNVTGGYILGNGSLLTGVAASYGNANVVANLAALGSNPVSTTGNITGGNILGGANVNATTHTGTTVSVTANITAGNLLTGGLMSSTGNAIHGNILTGGLISATANITGNFFIGNGSQLTGITATSSYGNANVVANLAALGTNPVSTTGNITGGNLNVTGNIVDTGGLTIITGSNGNIVLAPDGTGIVTVSSVLSTTGNIIANAVSTGNLVVGGNITGSYIIGLVAISALGNIIGTGNIVGSTLSSTGNVNTVGIVGTGNISTTGNISGNFFIGNGSQLTGVVASSNVGSATKLVNGTTEFNIPAANGNVVGNIGGVTNVYTFSSTGMSVVGNITSGNLLVDASLQSSNTAGGAFTILGSTPTTANTRGGNITIQSGAGNGANIGGSIFIRVGNSGNATDSSQWGGDLILNAGNATGETGRGGNIRLTAGQGNGNAPFSGSIVITAGQNGTSGASGGSLQLVGGRGNTSGQPGTFSLIGGVASGTDKSGLDSIIRGSLGTGAGTPGNVAIQISTALASGTTAQTASNVVVVYPSGAVVTGLISASGNISGNFFIGNGSQLTGVVASSNVGSASKLSNGTTEFNIPAANGNVVGNIGGVTNVYEFASTGMSVAGNITGNFFIGNGSQLTGIAASYGNANVVANLAALGSNPISTTGNVTGGNLNLTGNIVDTGGLTIITGSNGNIALAPNGTGIVTASGALSATGNITGNFFIGNGSLLTGIAASYGNANVVANLAALGSNPISTTGNITGGNLVIAGNTATVTTANYSIGYLNVPQVSFAANATTALTDSGKHYYSTSASNLTLTIADNSAVSWPVGTSFIVVNRGTGNITVAPASGVSLYLAGNSTSANRTLTTYNLATCLNLAANVWMISGSGLV